MTSRPTLRGPLGGALLSIGLALTGLTGNSALAATETTPGEKGGKPNILLIVSDDHGYGDIGVYGGGEGRGMPTPNLDKMADEGITFFSF